MIGGAIRSVQRHRPTTHGLSRIAKVPYQTIALARCPDGYETPPLPNCSGCGTAAVTGVRGAARSVMSLRIVIETKVKRNAAITGMIGRTEWRRQIQNRARAAHAYVKKPPWPSRLPTRASQ